MSKLILKNFFNCLFLLFTVDSVLAISKDPNADRLSQLRELRDESNSKALIFWDRNDFNNYRKLIIGPESETDSETDHTGSKSDSIVPKNYHIILLVSMSSQGKCPNCGVVEDAFRTVAHSYKVRRGENEEEDRVFFVVLDVGREGVSTLHMIQRVPELYYISPTYSESFIPKQTNQGVMLHLLNQEKKFSSLPIPEEILHWIESQDNSNGFLKLKGGLILPVFDKIMNIIEFVFFFLALLVLIVGSLIAVRRQPILMPYGSLLLQLIGTSGMMFCIIHGKTSFYQLDPMSRQYLLILPGPRQQTMGEGILFGGLTLFTSVLGLYACGSIDNNIGVLIWEKGKLHWEKKMKQIRGLSGSGSGQEGSSDNNSASEGSGGSSTVVTGASSRNSKKQNKIYNSSNIVSTAGNSDTAGNNSTVTNCMKKRGGGPGKKNNNNNNSTVGSGLTSASATSVAAEIMNASGTSDSDSLASSKLDSKKVTTSLYDKHLHNLIQSTTGINTNLQISITPRTASNNSTGADPSSTLHSTYDLAHLTTREQIIRRIEQKQHLRNARRTRSKEIIFILLLSACCYGLVLGTWKDKTQFHIQDGFFPQKSMVRGPITVDQGITF